jgi:hypothetical protein
MTSFSVPPTGELSPAVRVFVAVSKLSYCCKSTAGTLTARVTVGGVS